MTDQHVAELVGDLAERGDRAVDVVGDDRGMVQRQQVAVLVDVLARLSELGQAESAPQRHLELGQLLVE